MLSRVDIVLNVLFFYFLSSIQIIFYAISSGNSAVVCAKIESGAVLPKVIWAIIYT